MSKWPHVPEEKKKKIFAYNKTVAVYSEMATDLTALLNALPNGQVKQLLKDDACTPILTKYNITGE